MKALVVDDDIVLADLVAFTLRKEGFQVIQAQDGSSALQRWADEKPDIVILDVNLPKTAPLADGFSVLQRIREKADTPIIMLTVRGEEDDIVKGLSMGADDYIVKPFSPRQFIARVQTVLRRSLHGPHGPPSRTVPGAPTPTRTTSPTTPPREIRRPATRSSGARSA